jgi:anti-sigma regulatory factor (Ser/Thr protein kinase)
MATVEVSFTAVPAHVRTARLVALAVARRAGVSDELIDEVRLAVGEACSRAVGVNQGKAPESPVVMRLVDEQDRFTVEVVDVGPLEASITGPEDLDLDTEALTAPADEDAGRDPLPDLLPPGFGLAVISGLVENVAVTSEVDGTHVRMTWPATDVMAPTTGD